ncbi:DUF4307 domain-containing protein [Quadrisphaera sp. INWT6]|uniref:DUF4307 domain-containing protein n=1 Tax=Quadrisphaera sp. INWT6 TaxID=2596917 RepID=UPI0018923E74|nr:DUF4307 domain-containing protein [Quadrisphaera sp. INWT6]
MTGAPVRPADRYGDPGPLRRRLRLAVVVGLAVALSAWAVWAGLGLATDRIDAQEQSFDVVDDSKVVVVFSVAKRADQDVVCTVEALSSTSARVGVQQVPVGADAGATSVQTVTVLTQQRATTGVVKGCAPAS